MGIACSVLSLLVKPNRLYTLEHMAKDCLHDEAGSFGYFWFRISLLLFFLIGILP